MGIFGGGVGARQCLVPYTGFWMGTGDTHGVVLGNQQLLPWHKMQTHFFPSILALLFLPVKKKTQLCFFCYCASFAGKAPWQRSFLQPGWRILHIVHRPILLTSDSSIVLWSWVWKWTDLNGFRQRLQSCPSRLPAGWMLTRGNAIFNLYLIRNPE